MNLPAIFGVLNALMIFTEAPVNARPLMKVITDDNPYGKYRFNVEGEFHRKGLRPLRQPDFRISLALFFVQSLSQHRGAITEFCG